MSTAPVDCRLAPSDAYAWTVLLVTGFACVAVLLSRLPLAPCVALCLVLASLASRELAEHAWRRGRRAVRRVRADAAGWWLHDPHGRVFGPARAVAGRIWAGGLLLILRDAQGARRRLLLGPGALAAGELRRVRVRASADLRGGAG